MMKEPSKYFDPLNVICFLLTIFHPKIVFRDFKMAFKVVIINTLSYSINFLCCLDAAAVTKSILQMNDV